MAIAIKVKVTKHTVAINNNINDTFQFGRPIQSSVDALYIDNNTSHAHLLTSVQGMISAFQSNGVPYEKIRYLTTPFLPAVRCRGDPTAQVYVLWEPDWIRVTDTNWDALKTHLMRLKEDSGVHVCYIDTTEPSSNTVAGPDSKEDAGLPPPYVSNGTG